MPKRKRTNKYIRVLLTCTECQESFIHITSQPNKVKSRCDDCDRRYYNKLSKERARRRKERTV